MGLYLHTDTGSPPPFQTQCCSPISDHQDQPAVPLVLWDLGCWTPVGLRGANTVQTAVFQRLTLGHQCGSKWGKEAMTPLTCSSLALLSRCVGSVVPMRLRSGADVHPGSISFHKDESLTSFSAALSTMCFSSLLTLAAVYSHVPGMHWQHCSHCKENPCTCTLLCPCCWVPGCLVKAANIWLFHTRAKL